MIGRRLEVRVWYPAAEARGERRPYYVGLEKEALPGGLVNAMADFLPAMSMLYDLEEITTHSYEDAPVAEDIGDAVHREVMADLLALFLKPNSKTTANKNMR